jgi:hypothetical protein
MKYIIVSALALLFASCTKTEFNCNNLGKTVNYKLNQWYCLEEGQTEFRIYNIKEGRCPINANCVWEGQVEFSIEFKGKSTKSGKIVLKSSDVPKNIANEINGYTFTVSEILPYPLTTTPVDTSTYTFSMKVD